MRQRLGLADRLSSRDIAQIFVQIFVQYLYLTNPNLYNFSKKMYKKLVFILFFFVHIFFKKKIDS